MRLEFAWRGTNRLRSISAGWFGRFDQALKFSNLCPHKATDRFGLVCREPVLEVAVAFAARTTRALSPTVHPAPVPTPYSRLPARMTGAGLCPTSARPRHI
jgi:hypothetical protein